MAKNGGQCGYVLDNTQKWKVFLNKMSSYVLYIDWNTIWANKGTKN